MSDKKYLNKSMVEFVLEQHTIQTELLPLYEQNQIKLLRFEKVLKYAHALSQTPRLGHFIPCDENDVPLEEPENYELWRKYGDFTQYGTSLTSKCRPYKDAFASILFEGCKVLEYNKKVAYIQCLDEVFGIGFDKGINKTLEDLIKYNLPLTEAGAKFFGYE